MRIQIFWILKPCVREKLNKKQAWIKKQFQWVQFKIPVPNV